MIKQRILDYEVQMIEYKSDELSRPNAPLNYGCSLWELESKIASIMGQCNHSVRWVGNCESSYLESFVYVLIAMSLKTQDLLTKLKQKIYQLSKRYLQKSRQKIVVQFLCLIQYTKDKCDFLRKYSYATKQIISILHYLESSEQTQHRFKTSLQYLQLPTNTNISQSFSILCDKFSFIQVLNPNQHTYQFRCGNDSLYLIIEKDCFFIVQRVQQVQTQIQSHGRNSQNKTLKFFSSPSTSKYNKQSLEEQCDGLAHIFNKQSQDFLCQFDSLSSQECSILDVGKTLKNIDQDNNPKSNLVLDRLKTLHKIQKRIPYQVIKRFNKKQKSNDNKFLDKLRKSRQKRRDLWFKLQEQYYLKKGHIGKKIKQSRNKCDQDQGPKMKLFKTKFNDTIHEKQRKNSFNSFSGLPTIDHQNDDRNKNYFDKRSTTKSHYEKRTQKSFLKQREISFNKKPQFWKETMNYENAKQIILALNNRLSVIQQENKLKFWDSQNKLSPRQKKFEIKSFGCSNQETLHPNLRISLNYIGKKQLNLLNYCPSPKNHSQKQSAKNSHWESQNSKQANINFLN